MISVTSTSSSDSRTVLQILKDSNQKPISQCEKGFCGECRLKLKKGTVDYINDPIGFTRKGEILPCICKPVGDIEVEVTCI
ncbi:class I ribonucleotide reductase maintenance protein YfaE [Pseudoalteromonas spongiae]|uniref:class I ribonucleotide reductase maintenance protein YfaE n=1 Tax=Pseudoalteromonas spongiae TaxID=298657 RepID=UPI000C2D3F8F|nr:class I ribonucleotide reductase maintenance protein YfaE [Pseudoalteromonas spongiae]